MFYIDKYAPEKIQDSLFHKNILEKIKTMAQDDSVPHLCFYGAEGTGKKRIIKLLLELLFDKDINKLKEATYEVVGSGNKTTEVVVKQSKYHIVIQPNNTNFDRYLIQDIVKKYAQSIPLGVFKSSRTFKVVLINNLDNLSYYAQTSLRRTMEKYSDTCRFIMWCRSLSRVIDPLKSRCTCIRVPAPTPRELFRLSLEVAYREKIKIDPHLFRKIVDKSDGNIKTLLWNMNLVKVFGKDFDSSNFTNYEDTISKIVTLITKKELELVPDIRALIYKLIITNIDKTKILKDIMFGLCYTDDEIISEPKKIEIIEAAAQFEHNLIRYRREIMHLEGFIVRVLKII